MPGPLIKQPAHFPGVTSLPAPIQSLIEAIFPPDDVMTPAAPGTAIIGKAASAIPGVVDSLYPVAKSAAGQALRPFSRSVDEVQKLIKAHTPSIADKAVNVPEGFLTADAPSQALVQQLKGPVPPVDPLKVLAGEKLSSRPPKLPVSQKHGDVKAPEGFYFANRQYIGTPPYRRPMAPMKRDPLVEEMAKRYKTFDRHQKKVSKR